MKANELMIGDWVLLDMNWAEDDPMYARLNYQPYQIKRGEDFDLAEETNCIGDADAYQPIPLTKEILEKNGFVDMDGGQYRWFLSDDECYYFGFSSIYYYTHSNFLNMTKEQQSGNQQQVKGFFLYVHELQHALRLCGIEKEIAL